MFSSGRIGLPTGYVSGTIVSASGASSGTFATHGITIGTYNSTFTNGANSDFINIQVVPEPSASGALLGGAAFALIALRRRRLA